MRRVYLDSCAYIYLIDDHPTWAREVARILSQAEAGKHEVVASPLVLHEVLTGLYSEEAEEPRAIHIYGLLTTHPGIRWIAYDLETADLSAQLRARHGSLKSPDAIHLATALREKCQVMVTNDAVLARVARFSGLATERLGT